MSFIFNPDVKVKRRTKEVPIESSPGILSRCEDNGKPAKRLMRTRSSPRVHFSPDPVSDILEIPRVSVYPALVTRKESLASLIPYLNHVEVDVFLADLETKDVREVGQLADMDSFKIDNLKGIEGKLRKGKVRKVRVVKKALRNYHLHLLKAKLTFLEEDKFSRPHFKEISWTSEQNKAMKYDLGDENWEQFDNKLIDMTQRGDPTHEIGFDKPANLVKSEGGVGSDHLYKFQSEVMIETEELLPTLAFVSKIKSIKQIEEENISTEEEVVENIKIVKEGDDESTESETRYNEFNENNSNFASNGDSENFNDVELFSDELDNALNSMEKKLDEKINRFQARLVS